MNISLACWKKYIIFVIGAMFVLPDVAAAWQVSGTQFQISGTDIYGMDYLVIDAWETLADLTSAIKNQNEELRDHITTLEAQITQLALEKETE